MPLPTPKKDETEKKFIPRCMSDSVMKSEFPQRERRFAVCKNIFNDGKPKNKKTKGK